MEIRVKVGDEKASTIRNLLNNGLRGKYVLQSVIEDKGKGEFIFQYKKMK
ncbi:MULTISPECIES: hypothetical protein [Methanobacterium]|nr:MULTISPECIES: hypothetical protein [Methanobacterium]